MNKKQSKSRVIILSLLLLEIFSSSIWAAAPVRVQARKPAIPALNGPILVPSPANSGFKGLAEFENNLLNAFQRALPGQEVKVLPKENEAYNAYLEISESIKDEAAEETAAKSSVQFDQAALRSEDSQDGFPVRAENSRLATKIYSTKEFAKQTKKWSPKLWEKLYVHLLRLSQGRPMNFEEVQAGRKAGVARFRWDSEQARVTIRHNEDFSEIYVLSYDSKAELRRGYQDSEDQHYKKWADRVMSGNLNLLSDEENEVLLSQLKRKEQASSGTDSGLSPADSGAARGQKEIPLVESVSQSHGDWKVNGRTAEVLEDRGYKTVLTHPYVPERVVKVSNSDLEVMREEVLKSGVLEMIGQAPKISEWGWRGYGFLVQDRVSGPRASEIVPGRWKPEEAQALKGLFRTLIRQGIYLGEAFGAGRDVILGVVSGSERMKAYVVSPSGMSMRVSEFRSGRSGRELMRYYEGLLRKWTGDKKASLRK